MTEKRAFLAWPPSCAGQFISDFEGRSNISYQCSAGVWTIGVGHTKGVREGMTCTDAQADEWLIEDIRECVDALGRYINRSVTMGQYIALVSLAFNIGPYNVITKCLKLMRALNAGDEEECAKQFLDITRCNGVELPGLVKRRQAEAKLFLEE